MASLYAICFAMLFNIKNLKVYNFYMASLYAICFAIVFNIKNLKVYNFYMASLYAKCLYWRHNLHCHG